MADNVFINDRAAIHQGSAGKSIAFPDVCLCPPGPPTGPIPTPLVNTAQAADLQGGALTVTIEGNPIAHNESYIAKSTGNEIARSTGGGVITHQVQGRAYFQTFSMNVFIEGKPAVRHMDLVTHNHLSKIPGNTPPTPWMSAMTAGGLGPVPKAAEQDANEGKDWLEIATAAPDGTPLPGAHFRVTTPSGKVLRGTTAHQGKAKVVHLAKGKCKVEWLDDAWQVAKAGAKTALPGSPATDLVATGAAYAYTCKLTKIRIRVLNRLGRPLRNAACDVSASPVGKIRYQADEKGWLEVWCAGDAKHVDLKVVRPHEPGQRRVQLQPLPGDDQKATRQRLWNLGYRGQTEGGAAEFTQAYGLDANAKDLEPHLARTERDHFSDDSPDELAEDEDA